MRFGWSAASIPSVVADVVVVVDVLRFTTAVDAAVGAGAAVFPYRWKDASAEGFARDVGAVLAGGGDPTGPSLSPLSLERLDAGARVVLPSPNGSTCAVVAHDLGAAVIAGCLRNAAAIGAWIRTQQNDGAVESVAVIAGGERWPDGSLRPALEDQLGAGAILAAFGGRHSPEAEAVGAMWSASALRAAELVASCVSGRELLARGRQGDVEFAADVNASDCVPLLTKGCFVDAVLRGPAVPC